MSDEKIDAPAVVIPVEPCLVCGVNVFGDGRGAVTAHWKNDRRRVRIGWTCGDAHAAQVESCRDGRGELRPGRKSWVPRRRAAAEN